MLPWQPIEFRGLNKIQIFGRGLLKEHFCKTFVKVSAVRYKKKADCHFSHYKSMETLSCNSNESI